MWNSFHIFLQWLMLQLIENRKAKIPPFWIFCDSFGKCFPRVRKLRYDFTAAVPSTLPLLAYIGKFISSFKKTLDLNLWPKGIDCFFQGLLQKMRTHLRHREKYDRYWQKNCSGLIRRTSVSPINWATTNSLTSLPLLPLAGEASPPFPPKVDSPTAEADKRSSN